MMMMMMMIGNGLELETMSLRPCFFIFCFIDIFRNKLGSEDDIKLRFIQTVLKLN